MNPSLSHRQCLELVGLAPPASHPLMLDEMNYGVHDEILAGRRGANKRPQMSQQQPEDP